MSRFKFKTNRVCFKEIEFVHYAIGWAKNTFIATEELLELNFVQINQNFNINMWNSGNNSEFYCFNDSFEEYSK